MFHNPDSLELSYEEKLDLAKKQKIIKHDNTRLSKLPWKTDKQVGDIKEKQGWGAGKFFSGSGSLFFLSGSGF